MLNRMMWRKASWGRSGRIHNACDAVAMVLCEPLEMRTLLSVSTASDLLAPAAVTDLNVAATTASSLTLTWTATGDDGNVGTAASYDLRYSTSPITAANFASATQVANESAPKAVGQAESLVITGLLPSTTYYVMLKVADEASNVSNSNVAAGTSLASTVILPVLPDIPPSPVLSATWDTTSGWGNSFTSDDPALTYQAVASPTHQGSGAIRLTFNSAVGATGMKYYTLPGSVSGTDGYAFWVYGDNSGATLQIRLSQTDWSAWDSPMFKIDFTGWRQLVVLKSECVFQNWGGNGQNWNSIHIFAPRMSTASGSVVVDDMAFYSGTAGLKVNLVPDAPPITLAIDQSQVLPPLDDMLKGNDFALINWGAGQADLNFDPITEALFDASGTKLVRFWTYCPPLNVSTGPGTYDWTKFDAQMGKIFSAGATTIMTCNFTPLWLSANGTKEGMPNDWTAYEKLIRETVQHTESKGWFPAYWEVWNEPNLNGGFLNPSTQANLDLIYSHFSHAVKVADPNAKVGGAGFASPDMAWITNFIGYAHTNSLPLDFVSWHTYDLLPAGIGNSIESVRAVVNQYPEFGSTKLLIDEWNSSGGPQNAYNTEYSAAFQVAALDVMQQHGLAGSTFFAFKDSSSPEFGTSGNDWGMVTVNEHPKASYQSFNIFAHLNGNRYTVLGGDGEVNAIAVQNGTGVDLMLYRFQPDANATDRTIHLSLPAWSGGNMNVSMELVDNAHSNSYYDLSQLTLQTVGQWSGLTSQQFSQLDLVLKPQAVVRLHITPSAIGTPGPLYLNTAPGTTVYAGATFQLPAPTGAAYNNVTWTLPSGWVLAADKRSVTVAASDRKTAHQAYLIATSGTASGTLRLDVVPPGVDATLSLDDDRTWPAGTTRNVTVTVRNSQQLGVMGSVTLWSNSGVQLSPASLPFNIAAGGTWTGTFATTLPANVTGTAAIVYPKLTIDSQQINGQPIAVAYPTPLAQPVVDTYTKLQSTLASSAAISSPQFGPAGTLSLQDGSFQPGVFGNNGVLLKAGNVTFPASVMPSQLGSLELWVIPQWAGTAAPDWGTFFNCTGASGWAKSMWDLRISNNAYSGGSKLIWALHDNAGSERDLVANIGAWVAGQAHHIMLDWNAYTGHTALYIDGVLAQENTVAGGLNINPNVTSMVFNLSSRSHCNAIFGPVRFSSVERIPGASAPVPNVVTRTSGRQLPIGNLTAVVSAGPDVTLGTGVILATAGSFADIGLDTWSATVDYGDGAGQQSLPLNANKTFAFNKTYSVPGAYTVTVRVNDGHAIGTGTMQVAVNTPPDLIAAPGTSYAFTGPVGAQTLNVTAGTLTVTDDLAAAHPNLTFAVRNSAAVTLNATQHIASLLIADSGGVTMNADGTHVLRTEALAILGSGAVNLMDNDLLVGTAALADIRGLIQAGYDGSTGPRIVSSSIVAGRNALGYAVGTDPTVPLPGGLFDGESVDADSIIVKFTYIGDANLDGSTDGSDVAIWAQNFTGALGANPANPRRWTQGDWNYDGSTDGSDVALWATAFTGALGGGGLAPVISAISPAGAALVEIQSGAAAQPSSSARAAQPRKHHDRRPPTRRIARVTPASRS